MNDLVQFVEVLFAIFAINKWLVFSLTFFGTLRYNCVIKTREIFNFISLINNSALLNLAFCY